MFSCHREQNTQFQLSAVPDAVEGLCIPVLSLGQLIKRLLAEPGTREVFVRINVLEHVYVILEPLQIALAHTTRI